MMLELFKGSVAGATIAAYGVGQQATIAILSLAVGFVALVWVFEIRSFREVIERGRADRAAEREAERAASARRGVRRRLGDGRHGSRPPPTEETIWQPPVAEPVSLADDWLAEELASGEERDERRRDRWRRRRSRLSGARRVRPAPERPWRRLGSLGSRAWWGTRNPARSRRWMPRRHPRPRTNSTEASADGLEPAEDDESLEDAGRPA